ncbi:MAG TPA: DUF503 domain-containing protein [Ktedonobacterales bacterium]
MYVATGRVTLRLFESASLKDKRQVVRSILARARNHFEVSAAEVGNQKIWNLAEIGVAYVSGESGHALDVIEEVIRSIEASRPDLEITQASTDVINVS